MPRNTMKYIAILTVALGLCNRASTAALVRVIFHVIRPSLALYTLVFLEAVLLSKLPKLA
jgi:hypothetical protein